MLSALGLPDFDFSKRSLHTLQMFADHYGLKHNIPWNTIKQVLLQPQKKLYLSQPAFNHSSRNQLLGFRTSFHETICNEFLVRENFDSSTYTQLNESIGTDGTRTRNLTHR